MFISVNQLAKMSRGSSPWDVVDVLTGLTAIRPAKSSKVRANSANILEATLTNARTTRRYNIIIVILLVSRVSPVLPSSDMLFTSTINLIFYLEKYKKNTINDLVMFEK